MLVTKKEVRQTSKKALSVLLAVVMIMTSMSVCFGTLGFTASAADDTDAVQAFVSAMKCDAMKSFSTSGGGATSGGSGSNKTQTRTYTYTAPSYAHYVQINNVINKLDAAIKGLDEYKNGHDHNNNGNCQDGWDKNTATDKCTDLGWIEKHLRLAIGDAELATLTGTYNLDALFTAVFNMDGLSYRNADGQDDADDTSTQNNVHNEATNILTVSTNKVAEKLLEYSSIAAIPENIQVSTTYTLKMFRQNFTTTTTNSCGGTDTTNHYHIAMNTKQTGGVPAVTTGSGSSQKDVLTSAETVFANNANYINAADVNAVLALSQDADALTLIKEAIATAKDSVISAHSEAVYNHFFDEVKIAAALKNLDDAIKFLGFKVTVDELNRLNAVDYSAFDEAQLLAHLTVFEAEIAKFDALEKATQDLIISSFGLNIDAIKTTCIDVRHEYEIIGIRRLKVQTDTHMSMYQGYNIDMVDDGTLTKEMITQAVATIGNDIALFGNYVQVYVKEVCGETYPTTLMTFYNALQKLGLAVDYNMEFLYKYSQYRDEIKNAVSEDSETLLESLMNYDSWYTGLKNLIDGMKTELGEENANKLFDELNEPMVEYIDNAYTVLNLRTEGEINTAYALYTAYVEANGTEITVATVSDYKALANSIGLINQVAFEFLRSTPNFTVSQEAIDKYNALMNTDFGYADFLASYGFSTFQTSTIGSFIREDSADDIARDNEDIDGDGIGEYVADDAKVEKVIKVLDAALTNADVSALLGLDIGSMLTEAIEGAIISDAFINTVCDMLYPLVLKEFGKVFANDLPAEAEGYTVNYKKHLHATLRDAGFEIYPDLLAEQLKNTSNYKNNGAYKDTVTRLENAYKEYSAMYGEDGYTTELDPAGGVNSNNGPKVILATTPWDSTLIRDEEGKLNLEWGIDVAKASGNYTSAELKALFYETFDDAVEGLKPLLLAIVANKEWKATTVSGFAVAGPFDAAKVSLDLSATQNSGYANLLVPVYEALNVPYTDVAKIEGDFLKDQTKDVELIIEAILEPIFTLVENIGKAPLDTVLGILPNLCYALSTQMVTPLLSMLKTKIAYIAPIGGLASCIGDIKAPEGQVDIDVGSMLNINDLIDLSDGLNSILKQFGLDIPAINQGYVATLGELVKINSQRKSAIYNIESGKGYHINANKADVLAYVVDYLLEALAQPGFLDMIGELLAPKTEDGEVVEGEEGTDETTPVEPEEGTEGEEKVDLLTTILESVQEDPDTAIAAIVELLNMEEYDTLKKYSWYNGYIDNVEVGTLTGTPAYKIYMNPANDWTKDKAEYLLANLSSIIDSVLKMTGAEFTLESKLTELLGGLFTNDTIASVIELVAGLELDEKLANLLKNQLGVDLAAFATMEYTEFEDGNIDGFVTALTEIVAPFAPAVDFLLEGKDIKLFKDTEGEVVIQGNDGYNNAIIPLLEALGLEVKALGENDDALVLILDALKGLIKDVIADPVNAILDILPGALYFLAGNNLATVVRNLLHPVYVVLDIIRPIYDVDLHALINGIEIAVKDSEEDAGVDTVENTEGTEEAEPVETQTLAELLGFEIDLDNLDLNVIFALAENFIDLGTLFDELKVLIYDVCKAIGTEYTSVSTFVKNENDWKKGAYSADFDKADMLTVILSFVLEWATVPENGAKLDELLGTDGIVASINSVFADVDISYGTPNWSYWFATEDAFNAYLAGNENLPNTLYALEYPNDWTAEKAAYVADKLPALVDTVIGLINADKEDAPATVSALLNGLIAENINAETLNGLVAMIADLLKDIDTNLIEAAGYLLDVDLAGLLAYTCEAEINSLSDFINELANVLDTYAGGLVNWLFFGDDYRFAKKSDETDTIVINGGLGYEKGLALILEALGVTLPAEANVKTVLGALAERVDAILAAPVDEVLGLLPNLIYFLNANGAGVALSNLLAPVNALLAKINGMGILENPIVIADLLKFTLEDGTEISIDPANLALANVVDILKSVLPGFDFTAVEDYLVNFCTGKITKGTYIFKMEAPKADVVTIVLTIALTFIKNEANAAKLDEMLGTEFLASIDEVLMSTPVEYLYPDYNYFDGEIDYDNGTIEVIESAITYPNDWTEEKAAYLAENLDDLVDIVVGMVSEYDSLAALLDDKVNVFTTETLNSLIALISDLLGNVDDELLGFGSLLNVDLVGLKAYTAPEGIETVDAFATELATILNTYAKGVVEWLLLGDDIKLFVTDDDAKGEKLEGEDIITINGANGYSEGLALILEALGCENLPEADGETEEIVSGVLASLAARIDEIFADPVNEVVELLPNVIYFLNANGVATSVNNLAGAFNALALKLKAFGLDITLDDLVNIEELCGIEEDLAISLDNLTIPAILELVSAMTGLDLSKLEDVLTGFALGKVTAYDSVSSLGYTAKMEFADEFDKHDMITVLVTAALLVAFETEGNEAVINEMIGDDIITAIKAVFEDIEIEYADIDWNYPLADNGTVDAMKYSIEYPNNWTEATAKYVADNLPEIGDLVAGLIDGNYDSLSALLKDKVNVFTTENLQAIVDLIANLLKDIDDGLLDAAGVLLGADVVGLKAYKAPEGIATADAFAAELAKVLNTYAKGLVEWLLLGEDYRFFVKAVDEEGLPVDFITINGAYGYSEGLALLLEALGCENLPAATESTESIVTGVLASLAALINKVLDKPVETIFEILPNVLYFLNANGVAAVIDNTIAALTALLEKLAQFGIELDINELVNLKSLMGIEDTDAAISLDNLSMAAILEAVSLMTGLDLTLIEDVLVGFALGKVDEYDSVSVKSAYKMTYADDFDKHDMVTVLANLVILTIADAKNEEFVKGLVGAEAYEVINNICNEAVMPVEIQEFDWLFTDIADTDSVVSALETSEIFESGKYGPLYTEEMAYYIAENFGQFVDNVVYLLGININGQSVDDLKELINGLLNGNLYNSANVVAIRDALAGVLAGIEGLEVNGKNVGKYIAGVLANSGVADISAVAKVEIPEFTENREMFVTYLCAVLEPLYPVLEWVLANKNIEFFVDLEKTAAIELVAGEGYAYGIIPLLEVLGCEGILAPDEYYAAVEADGNVVITSILDPLLNRVDAILAEDPAGEILDMLPNIIYFLNSNGVDTVVRNTLHAVYGLLNAISPIAEIDLYEIIGIDLADINFEWLFAKVLEIVKNSTGYEFSNLDASALCELSVGTVESYTSLNGKTAYKMVYANTDDITGGKAEMATVIMRLLITFVMHENNQEMLLGLLRDHLGMTPEAEKYIGGVLYVYATAATETYLGMDQALATTYYLYYGADIGVSEVVGGFKDLNLEWQKILKELGYSDDENASEIGKLIAGIFELDIFEDIISPEGIAPNGLIAFVEKIISIFKSIIEWFRAFFA